MKIIEPISRKLIILGKAYLSVLTAHMEDLGMNRYFYALTLIAHHNGELTQNALAEKLGQDKSIIVNVVDTLEDKQFVYRQVNPADRRQYLLYVTDKAKGIVPRIIKAFERMNRSAAKDISAQEMEVFEKVLSKMRDNLGQFDLADTTNNKI